MTKAEKSKRGKVGRRVIVEVEKLADPEERTIMRALERENPEAFATWSEVDSQRSVGGERAVWAIELPDEWIERFQQAENLVTLEDDEIDRALAYEVLDVDAQGLLHGTDASALDSMGYRSLIERGLSGKNVFVGIADTGIRREGYIADKIAAVWSWYDSVGADVDGHGTWCANAATPPGAQAIIGKVLDDEGSGYRSDIISFMRQFTRFCLERNAIGVLSLSLGGPGFSQLYEDACLFGVQSGVFPFVAAGNDGTGVVNAPGNCPSAVTIAAIDHRSQQPADFSNHDANLVELAAPGVDLDPGSYSGTSMATPLAAKVFAAGLDSITDKLGAVTVISALYQSANEGIVPAAYGKHGVVSALNLANLLKPQVPVVERIGMSRLADLPPLPVPRPMIVTYKGRDYARVSPL